MRWRFLCMNIELVFQKVLILCTYIRVDESVIHNFFFFLWNNMIPKLTWGTKNTKFSCSFPLICDLFTDTNFVLAGYKTEQCTKPPRLCRQGYACPHYHNSRDRRRSPRTFKYRYINVWNTLLGQSRVVINGLVCLSSYAMGIPSGTKTPSSDQRQKAGFLSEFIGPRSKAPQI